MQVNIADPQDGSANMLRTPCRDPQGRFTARSPAQHDAGNSPLTAFLIGSVGRPPVVAANLLDHFGSLSAVPNSAARPLAGVEGMTHAVSLGAAAVILARNAGEAEPTARSREVDGLKRIVNILGRLGIAFHDYVIVGRPTMLSFRAKALL